MGMGEGSTIEARVIRRARKAYRVVLVDTETDERIIVAEGESEKDAREKAMSVLTRAATQVER